MLTENAKHHGLTSKVWTVQRATSSEQCLSKSTGTSEQWFCFVFFYNKVPAIMTEDLTRNNLQ